MRYLITVRVTAQPATPVPAELMEAIAVLGEEATKSGALLETSGLAPSAEGARVTLTGGSISVTDGPFAEAKELISYALFEVATKDEAVEWAARFVRVHRDHWAGWEGQAEVLRLFGPEDFAPPA
ncbi:YciI family protein [Spongiactinospora sp. TRM90649]|uniref:YciI family protein n=1 Tax=Spongiactinospora sp. TRM90649 TaxID=3031114 RepID=UPI0023F79019|nr:YciI family protein [Spongiactinospora sp. TRM90649]MDF5751723.1 YciI family protein [Spongiactinospora sp. TRM90649]